MKITFSSPLASLLRSYITLKQALGRKYALEASVLFSFDRFLADPKTGDHNLTSETFCQWCQKLEKLKPGVRRAYMRIIRNFCLYRRRLEPHCFVPDIALFPRPHQHVSPYIFSPAEIQQLLDQCSRFKTASYSPLRPQLFRLVVVLLFTTGMRRGELLRLTVRDYDSHEGTLLIRASKFHKSRLLPLPGDVRHEIDHFLETRDRHSLPISPETPLVWSSFGGGRAYTPESLRYGLEQLLKRAKIQTLSGRLPRTHDWRQHADSPIMPTVA